MSAATLGCLGVLALVTWLDLVGPFLEETSRWSRRGEASYRAEDWDAAREHFERAAEAEPGGSRDYNRAAAAYRQGDFEGARSGYESAQGSPDLAPGRAAYDAGNAAFRAGDYPGARDLFRASLRANPGDEDARRNFELASKLAESPPAPDSRNSPGSGDESPPDPSRENPGSTPDSSRADAPAGAPRDSQEAGGDPADESAQAPEADSAPGEPATDGTEGEAASRPERMTPAEAMRLLNAVTPEERELLEARLRAMEKRRAEKDW